MSLRVAVVGEANRENTGTRSESEPEEGVLSRRRQTRNRVIYACPG